jgi:hypothetical protein
LRHKFLYGGGWDAASFSLLSHCLSVAFVFLICGVGRQNLLQALGTQLSAYTKTSSRLFYSKSLPLEM